MKKNKVLKIVLFGPESTGKTTLAERLAAYYKTNWVPEYAREYLQKKWDYNKDACSLEDLLIIMEGQSNLEDKLLEKSNRLIFCDTNSVVTQIWSETHFNGYCSKEILYNAKNSNHDFSFSMESFPFLPFKIQIPIFINKLYETFNFDTRKQVRITKL